MDDEMKKVGALWLKTSQKGHTFMSGEIELPGGSKLDVVVFKNTHKQPGEKTPDYRIYESRPREAQPSAPMRQVDAIPPKASSGEPEVNMEDIPF